ncbi:MAG TPA: efflux RND transporter periplasmic adaptor subunit [Pseudomonadales bacterium]
MRYLMTAIALAMLLVACGKKPEPAAPLIRPVKTAVVIAGADNWMRRFPGTIYASNKSELAFRVSGEIIELPATAGSNVKKGDLLARLDPTEYQLQLDDRKASFDLSKAQYERAKKLVGGAISQADYDKVFSQYKTAEAVLSQAEQNLEYTQLRAPSDAIISRVMVDNRQNVQAKQAILNIQAVETADVVFQLPESIVARINRQRDDRDTYAPQVLFDSHPDQLFNTRIREFDTEADPKTQSYRVTLTMDRPKTFPVLEGMTVTVLLDLSKLMTLSNDIPVLPAEAIFVPADQPLASSQRFVWKLNPATMSVHRQAVVIGRITAMGIEVTEGIADGDEIVTAGVHFLTEGQTVRRLEKERGL